jgi:hypothetical protein
MYLTQKNIMHQMSFLSSYFSSRNNLLWWRDFQTIFLDYFPVRSARCGFRKQRRFLLEIHLNNFLSTCPTVTTQRVLFSYLHSIQWWISAPVCVCVKVYIVSGNLPAVKGYSHVHLSTQNAYNLPPNLPD